MVKLGMVRETTCANHNPPSRYQGLRHRRWRRFELRLKGISVWVATHWMVLHRPLELAAVTMDLLNPFQVNHRYDADFEIGVLCKVHAAGDDGSVGALPRRS